FFASFFTVKQQTRAIIERFGRYVRTAKPGLNMKVPFIDHIVQRVSLRVQQLIVEVETKTKDNVFVKLFVAVQYRVKELHEDVVLGLGLDLDQGQRLREALCRRAIPRRRRQRGGFLLQAARSHRQRAS